MTASRPEQAVLTRDTDMSKTNEPRAVIEAMVEDLNDHRIEDIGQFFAVGFRWMGNRGWTRNEMNGDGALLLAPRPALPCHEVAK